MSVISQKVSGERKIKGKTPITPNKLRVFDEMLTERVESEACDENLAIQRCTRLNRLIGDALYTISKRSDPVQEKKNHTILSRQICNCNQQCNQNLFRVNQFQLTLRWRFQQTLYSHLMQ